MKKVCKGQFEEGMEPKRMHYGDAGADLRSKERAYVAHGGVVMVHTGVKVDIPYGYVGLLFARSSMAKRGLMMANGVGVIDSGYHGEICVPFTSVFDHGASIAKGERIAQLVFVPCEMPEFEQVDDLGHSERGDDGFGSTGAE